MANPNMSRNYVVNGSEGTAPGSDSTQNVGPSLVALLRTRGAYDPQENRLPVVNDITVEPTDPIVEYDAFVYTAVGTSFSGVKGEANVSAGDYIVFIGTTTDPTVATNWISIANTQPNYANNPKMAGTPPGFVRVVSSHLPFFP